MTEITKEQIETAYGYGKKYFLKEITLTKAAEEVSAKTGMAKGQLQLELISEETREQITA